MLSVFEPSPSWAGQFALVFALIFARCLGTTLFVPILGGANVPRTVRVVVAVALAALVFPVASVDFDASTSSSLADFAVSAGWEFVFGASTGFVLRLFFEGAILAGETIARIGGISVSGAFDPTLGEEISSISRFLLLLFVVVFATTGGVERFLEGFLDGFAVVAPGSVALGEEALGELTKILTLSFALALKIAAPIVFATGAVYLATGFLARVVSRLDVASISFNSNALLTLVVLALTIGFSCRTFQTEIASLLERLFVRT